MKRYLLVVCFLVFSASAHAKLVSQPVAYTHGETTLEGYIAYDDALAGKLPGVLVVHEWWGLNDYVRSRVDRLAGMGYVAFALDMYGKDVWTTDPKKAGELAGHLRGTPLLRERAEAGLDLLGKNERVDPKRIAAIGYCFGGTTVLELAYGGADIAGIVTFHGGLTVPGPEDLDRIKAKILVCHGAADGFVKPETIAEFQSAMAASGADWQMVLYGGAVHSFTNPDADKVGIDGIAYNRRADERSWALMQLFFSELFAAKP